MSSAHFVSVKIPVLGADFYAVYCKGDYPYITFVAIKDGQPAFTEEKRDYSHFIQGRAPDPVGNKEILHTYLEGQITVLPHTDKVWSFDLEPAATPWYYNTLNRVLKVGSNVCTYIKVSDVQRNPNGSPYTGHGGNTGYEFSIETDNEHYQDQSTSCYFELDYANLSNSKAKETVTVSGKNSYGPYNWAYTNSLSCTSVYLGRVQKLSFNDSTLRTEVQRVRTTTAPSSFLTDLYDKLGTPQVNNYGNIAAARKWRQMVPPVLALIKKRNIKSVSDLYLWWKYSYKTTKMDIESYVEWFRQLAKQEADPTNGSHYSLTYMLSRNDVVRYNIYLTPYSIGVLEALGLDINFVNTWDLVPFSFVVDWFISVEKTLKSLDVADLESKIHLISLLTSRKVTQRYFPETNCNFAGDLTSSYYQRTISASLPRDVCDLHFNNPSSHLLDGTSLFISCKRK